MVKEIVKDLEILNKKSIPFVKGKDDNVVKDLLDTAKAHEDKCAGLAAVQINNLINCFVIRNPKTDKFEVYINPFILKKSFQTYDAEEGCLSLEGTRMVKRYEWVDVMYCDLNGKYIKEHLTGYKAEIFQHEYDHLFGKLI